MHRLTSGERVYPSEAHARLLVRRLTAQSPKFRFQFGEASLGLLAQQAFLLGALAFGFR
jgi:hypothetical protein